MISGRGDNWYQWSRRILRRHTTTTGEKTFAIREMEEELMSPLKNI
jgi:hypothetical protein